VQDLLRAIFEILDAGAIPWSECQTQPTADAAGNATAGPAPANGEATPIG